MWTLLFIGYVVVGLTAAGFMLSVFPPQNGYRPPIRWIVLAVTTYVSLWPFLVMIGLGFAAGQWFQRPITRRKPIIRRSSGERFVYRALYDEPPN